MRKEGLLVYSTCTFAKEENEDVISHLLDVTNATVIRIDNRDDFNKSIGDIGAVRLYPFNFKGEGHFICLIKCNDEHNDRVRIGNKIALRKDV